MTTKQKLFAKIDTLLGKARQTYFISPLNEVMIGRGKSASACLASNVLVQLLQSMWPSSGTGKLTGGGGTTGKSALGKALIGTGPVPDGWTEAIRWQIFMDVLTFKAFPPVVVFIAHIGLAALSDAQLRTEASKRWGKKAGTAFVPYHKATVTFLSAISEISVASSTKRHRASTLPNLSELTGEGKTRAKKKKASSRPVAPSASASARAKEIAQSLPVGKGRDAAEAIAKTLAKVDAMAPV